MTALNILIDKIKRKILSFPSKNVQHLKQLKLISTRLCTFTYIQTHEKNKYESEEVAV